MRTGRLCTPGAALLAVLVLCCRTAWPIRGKGPRAWAGRTCSIERPSGEDGLVCREAWLAGCCSYSCLPGGLAGWVCVHLSPCLLCSPLPPCSDTAVLLDKVGQAEAAVDYATGALVNAQVGSGAWLGCWGAACGNAGGAAWGLHPLRIVLHVAHPPPACLQTLAGIMSGQQRAVQHPILEPFYRLLADLKEKVGPLRLD